MLVLSRKLNEKIVIDGGIVVTVVKIDRNQVRLGIEAPGNVRIFREEIAAAVASRIEREARRLWCLTSKSCIGIDRSRSDRSQTQRMAIRVPASRRGIRASREARTFPSGHFGELAARGRPSAAHDGTCQRGGLGPLIDTISRC